jgi:hypothetical protein
MTGGPDDRTPDVATVAADDRARRPLFVAAVLAADGALFSAAAESPEASLRHVAEFVRGRLDTRLWPGDAADVRELLDGGRYDAAVSRYFDCVGRRWDEEWLCTARVGDGDLQQVDAPEDLWRAVAGPDDASRRRHPLTTRPAAAADRRPSPERVPRDG